MYKEKICKECGETFTPVSSSQKLCKGPHQKICQSSKCGKLFTVKNHRLGDQLTCNATCAAAYRGENPKELDPIACSECLEIFVPQHFNEIYCSKIHNRTCASCGELFPVDKKRLAKYTPACSPTCGSKMSHTEEAKKVRKANNVEKYGVEHTFQREDIKAKVKDHPAVKNTRYGSEGFRENMLKKHGVENGFQLPNAVPGRISKPNLRWQQLLEELTGASWEFEKFFSNVGNVDLYCELNGVKLAIEISPTATHNSHVHKIACTRRGCEDLPCKDHGKTRIYHQLKTVLLKEEHEVELITIFDWMDETKLIQFIRAKLNLLTKRIGAKSCEVREITQREANAFLKEHHLLGASRKQTHCYGLFFKGELLQVQTYSPRKETGSWEAKRLATKTDWLVIGGVSRLTKRFMLDANPKEIVAFSDLNLGYGGFDSKFNSFQVSELQKPTLCWSKGDRMILQKSAAFQSADRLIGVAKNSKSSIYPEDWTNEQVFLAEGWLPVWDCGKIREVWNNPVAQAV